VTKGSGSLPSADVSKVSGASRVQEVARLMSGRATAAALRRAAELLREGGMPVDATSKGRTTARTM
jgi:DNA repair ATPase RecN